MEYIYVYVYRLFRPSQRCFLKTDRNTKKKSSSFPNTRQRSLCARINPASRLNGAPEEKTPTVREMRNKRQKTRPQGYCASGCIYAYARNISLYFPIFPLFSFLPHGCVLLFSLSPPLFSRFNCFSNTFSRLFFHILRRASISIYIYIHRER